jgi:hypothetical protein
MNRQTDLTLVIKLSTALLGMLWSVFAHAADEVELFFGHYGDDQNLTVLTPGVRASKEINEEITLSGKYTFERFEKTAPETAFDAVSSASVTASGGSGFQQDRQEGVVSGQYLHHDDVLAMGIIASHEEDFRSQAASIAYSRDFLQKNLTLTGQYNFTFDTITDGRAEKTKASHGFTFAATQVIDPKTWIASGYSFTGVTGFQSQPIRQVTITTVSNGTSSDETVDEVHPDSRLRHVMFVRAKRHLFTSSAIDVNVSRYFDDWGVGATTLETGFLQHLDDNIIVRLRYRLYDQSAAEFYQPVYGNTQTYMTADRRLRPFVAHLTGIKLLFTLPGFGQRWTLIGGVDQYWETNAGLSAQIVKVAVKYLY